MLVPYQLQVFSYDKTLCKKKRDEYTYTVRKGTRGMLIDELTTIL